MERLRFVALHEVEPILKRSPPGTKFIYHVGLLSRDKSGLPELSRISGALFRLSGAAPLFDNPNSVRRASKKRTGVPFVVLTQRRTTFETFVGCDYVASIARYPLPGEIERAFVCRL